MVEAQKHKAMISCSIAVSSFLSQLQLGVYSTKASLPHTPSILSTIFRCLTVISSLSPCFPFCWHTLLHLWTSSLLASLSLLFFLLSFFLSPRLLSLLYSFPLLLLLFNFFLFPLHSSQKEMLLRSNWTVVLSKAMLTQSLTSGRSAFRLLDHWALASTIIFIVLYNSE